MRNKLERGLAHTSEDEADILISVRRENEPRVSLAEVLRKHGTCLACGAANIGRRPPLRRPEPAESRLRAELPAPQNSKLTHCSQSGRPIGA